MGDTTGILLSVLFGAIGMGYFVYGKKQQRMVPLAAGLLLCVYPWFVSNVWALLGVGAVLTTAPFFWRE